MSYIRYLKKDGKYLAYRKVEDESDYWEVSEINQRVSGEWYLTDDIELARIFNSYDEAQGFLAKSRGEFWKDVRIEK